MDGGQGRGPAALQTALGAPSLLARSPRILLIASLRALLEDSSSKLQLSGAQVTTPNHQRHAVWKHAADGSVLKRHSGTALSISTKESNRDLLGERGNRTTGRQGMPMPARQVRVLAQWAARPTPHVIEIRGLTVHDWLQVHSRPGLRVAACRQCRRQGLPQQAEQAGHRPARRQAQLPHGPAAWRLGSSSGDKDAERPSGSKPAQAGEEEDRGVAAALRALRWYKETVSPLLPRSCRFLPTCSEYSMQAYRQFGVARGTLLTAWRLVRCNPLNLAVQYQGKYDPPMWPPPGFRWLAREQPDSK